MQSNFTILRPYNFSSHRGNTVLPK